MAQENIHIIVYSYIQIIYSSTCSLHSMKQHFSVFPFFVISSQAWEKAAMCIVLCGKFNAQGNMKNPAINPFSDLFNSFVFLSPRILNNGVEAILQKAVRGNKITNSWPKQWFLMLLGLRVRSLLIHSILSTFKATCLIFLRISCPYQG